MSETQNSFFDQGYLEICSEFGVLSLSPSIPQRVPEKLCPGARCHNSHNRLSKEGLKVSSQPSSYKGLIKEEVKVTSQPSSHRGIFMKETKVPSQSSSHMGLIKGMKVGRQPISQRGVIKERKVTRQSQPSSHTKEENSRKIVTSQPKSHQEAGVKPRLLKAMPPIALVSREDQEALEKKLETMTRHDQNLLILKNFLKVNQEKKGGIEGVFLATSFPTDANRVEERVKKMATSLARVSLRQWMFAGLHRLEEKFSSDFYVRFEESSFKSFTKFILHMTDMEDLERVNLYDKLNPEYRKFYDENLKHLKSDENPFKLVAKEKINFDGFPLLREQDVGKVLLRHIRDTVIGQVGSRLDVVGWMPFGLQGYVDSCFEERCNGRFVELARTVLLHYVPMEDVKIHSILDCHVCPHDCTFKAFRREAVSNVVEILESGKYMNHELASSIDFSLSLLINDRRRFVKWTSFIAANVLTFGPFGSFSKEVFELVNIADARRRFQAHRFISKHHILWAVGLTRYKCFVDRLVESIGLRNVVEEPATCPSYSVYMSARITANIFGVEVVRVEHVVVATIFEIHKGKHRKNIRKFNSVGCVRKFLDDVRNYNKKSDDRSSSISS